MIAVVTILLVGSEVLTVVVMNVAIFWDVSKHLLHSGFLLG
jgi:hypothetical protein